MTAMPRFDISHFIADGGSSPRYWYVTLGVAVLVGLALDKWVPLGKR